MSAQAVLFDAPGPKARRRHAILTVVGLIAAAALFGLFIWRLYETAQLEPQLWTPFLQAGTWTQYLIPGLINTLQAALVSVVLAIVFGLIFGMGRLSQIKPLRWACGVIVEFFRVPDPQLGYLLGGWLTMGMILSLPMVLVGVGAMIYASRTRSA